MDVLVPTKKKRRSGRKKNGYHLTKRSWYQDGVKERVERKEGGY